MQRSQTAGGVTPTTTTNLPIPFPAHGNVRSHTEESTTVLTGVGKDTQAAHSTQTEVTQTSKPSTCCGYGGGVGLERRNTRTLTFTVTDSGLGQRSAEAFGLLQRG